MLFCCVSPETMINFNIRTEAELTAWITYGRVLVLVINNSDDSERKEKSGHRFRCRIICEIDEKICSFPDQRPGSA